MSRFRATYLLAAVIALSLAMVPLTAGGQEDGRPPGTKSPTAPAPEPRETGTAFNGWDGDGPAPRTLVHSGDSTIQGGLCVGFDCSANEPMGFATIKIEENNLRIAAADSSSVSGFPTTDWQIEFNSSSSGGGSYFMVRDCGSGGAAGSVDSTCGGVAQLTIEGGADNESIHVDSSGNQGGNVGFGTATPVVDLHALSGNTPTLRLEQDNSSGFTPQSWDLAGNESNFFIRDVTNGSALPLRIEPGTASNTLYLDNQERIGIGTTAPGTTLHLRQSGTPGVRLEDPSLGGFWDLRVNAGNDFNLRSNDAFNNWLVNDVTNETTISGGLRVNGGLIVNGGCTGCGAPSDRAIKRQFAAIDPAKVLAGVVGLDITTWSYTADQPWIRHIGPTAQDFARSFGVGSSAGLIDSVDMNGVALAAIQALAAENATLLERIEALETALANGS